MKAEGGCAAQRFALVVAIFSSVGKSNRKAIRGEGGFACIATEKWLYSQDANRGSEFVDGRGRLRMAATG